MSRGIIGKRLHISENASAISKCLIGRAAIYVGEGAGHGLLPTPVLLGHPPYKLNRKSSDELVLSARITVHKFWYHGNKRMYQGTFGRESLEGEAGGLNVTVT